MCVDIHFVRIAMKLIKLMSTNAICSLNNKKVEDAKMNAFVIVKKICKICKSLSKQRVKNA